MEFSIAPATSRISGSWFRLRNGEKALLYLTDRAKAVHVRTTNGYSLLVSPDNPDGFLDALKRMR